MVDKFVNVIYFECSAHCSQPIVEGGSKNCSLISYSPDLRQYLNMIFGVCPDKILHLKENQDDKELHLHLNEASCELAVT